jgi:hypothetical protein
MIIPGTSYTCCVPISFSLSSSFSFTRFLSLSPSPQIVLLSYGYTNVSIFSSNLYNNNFLTISSLPFLYNSFNSLIFQMSSQSMNTTFGNELAVKVSLGDEIRRATFNGATYVALRDLCATLFELDPTNTVLKYQDDDGDKITLSSDVELQEALLLAKVKNLLRMYVVAKVPVTAIPLPIAGMSLSPPSSPLLHSLFLFLAINSHLIVALQSTLSNSFTHQFITSC